MTGTIGLTPDGEQLVIQFPYRDDLVDEVRMIPGRRWDRDNKVWRVPVDEVSRVVNTFRPHGFTLDSGVGELVGAVGRATTGLAPEGKVFVRGEYWNASADSEIASGESVEITAVEGLRLRVRRADTQRP